MSEELRMIEQDEEVDDKESAMNDLNDAIQSLKEEYTKAVQDQEDEYEVQQAK